MPRAVRLGALVASLGLLAAWILRVAVVTDYQEEPILLLGGLWFLTALALSWNTRRRLIKSALASSLAVAMVAVGLLADAAAGYQQQVRLAIAHNVMEAVARSLHVYEAGGKELPAVEWEVFMPAVEDAGAWRPLSIPYQNSARAETFAHIPRKDPWGCKYRYAKMGEHGFTLDSSGPDRRWKTPDDLTVTGETILPDGPRPLPVYPRR